MILTKQAFTDFQIFRAMTWILIILLLFEMKGLKTLNRAFADPYDRQIDVQIKLNKQQPIRKTKQETKMLWFCKKISRLQWSQVNNVNNKFDRSNNLTVKSTESVVVINWCLSGAGLFPIGSGQFFPHKNMHLSKFI